MPDNELLNRGLAELRALGTELEKAVKTASEEAKEGWEKLQPHLQRAEEVAATKANEVAQEVGESASEVLSDIHEKLEKLRQRIQDERNPKG